MTSSRRSEALSVAEELLADIELSRLQPVDLARKTSRLARLLDDADAMSWLLYETAGYPSAALDVPSSRAAARSNRQAQKTDDGTSYWTADLAELAAEADSARTSLGAQPAGTSSAEFAVTVEREKALRSNALREIIVDREKLIQRIVGSFYDYAAAVYQELRFGSAVETAFAVVRDEVDGSIARLVPDALPKLSAAFENTASANPEDWASAAATCRRLLRAAADALNPPGPDKDGRKMGDEQYVNRLVDWISTQSASATLAGAVASDLEFLGRRLDAVLDAGHKGAHTEVSRFDASRFVTGTYLLLGDILRLQTDSVPS